MKFERNQIAMMAMTIRSSISVNCRFLLPIEDNAVVIIHPFLVHRL